jgi:hypothetical protein
MEGVNGFGFLAGFEFEGERGGFEFREVRRDAAKGGGGDGLGIAAPGFVAGVDPTLEGFDFGAIDRKGDNDAMVFRLDGRDAEVHGGRADGPKEQAQGDAKDYRDDSGEATAWGDGVHGVLLINRLVTVPVPSGAEAPRLELVTSLAKSPRESRFLGQKPPSE